MTDRLQDIAKAPARRVVLDTGDSNFSGFAANADNATGPRSTLQRVFQEEGIRFRMVGRGYGAPNGAGFTWGRYPKIDDFHDHPRAHIGDWRHWAFGGRRLSKSSAVTAIDATANTFTVPGHTLAVGVACTLDFSGTTDPPVLAVQQPIYYVATVVGDVVSFAQYEGSTTPIDITYAGSGEVRLNEGLIEMLPKIAEACDEAPTDVIAGGGTNDISALIVAGYSEAETLAILQQRERDYEKQLARLFPRANKHRVCVLDFKDDTASSIAASAVALAFNAWLVKRAPTLGRTWNVIDATAKVPASAYADNVHLSRVGYEIWGEEIARQVVQGIGAGLEGAKVPRTFVRRAAQACIELRATTDRATFPAQAALNVGSNPFFFRVRYMPFELKTGTNVIVMQENPYNDGCMLTMTGPRLNLYHKSAGAGAVIAANAYTECLKQYRWHDLFVFVAPGKEAALLCNGRLVQRVVIGEASITSQDGWAVGAFSSLSSAPGLYQGFLVGHGAALSIEDAWELAIAAYYDDEDPEGTTYKAKLDEGTGTTLASTVHDTTAGTLAVTTGGWVGSGKYEMPANDGYRKPELDQRIAPVTAAYTATYGELVKCDPTSAGFTVTLPTAVGHEGEPIWVSNVTASTNAIVVDGNASETLDGATTATINTAWGDLRLISDGANWAAI
ncbi:SGNH/GDSL hydrolase family protein [Sorangium sp. So ce362]|uniref:SGNH/GDSL hydrolase family protein n=1 Tax=Sorangium sp. So ce362 TaxID=3133303 RepID=UPI003F5D990B